MVKHKNTTEPLVINFIGCEKENNGKKYVEVACLEIAMFFEYEYSKNNTDDTIKDIVHKEIEFAMKSIFVYYNYNMEQIALLKEKSKRHLKQYWKFFELYQENKNIPKKRCGIIKLKGRNKILLLSQLKKANQPTIIKLLEQENLSLQAMIHKKNSITVSPPIVYSNILQYQDHNG